MSVSSWPSKQFKFCDPKVSVKDANISLGGFPPFLHLPKEVQVDYPYLKTLTLREHLLPPPPTSFYLSSLGLEKLFFA
jgi:hypothetical protein